MSAVRILQGIVVAFILIDVLLVVKLIMGKLKYGKLQNSANDKMNNFFNAIIGKNFDSKSKISENDYFDIKQNVILEKDESI